MGKKVKTGKARKDKYYRLAKETGFRSRAAFKLLQLNRKFEFLEKSRVCIDLCAAPGGWLQVCQQNMPMSSLIIGVDLVSIKPIPNVVTFQEDITSEKCRQTLRKEMHTWKADVVLHDGAPNVGMNWIHDAFQQAQLTLQALKLASEFLRKGGCFVTKVFRSKDYHALLWVFKQLFKSVHATKPQASRNESAEIFVVCQHYRAPDKLDPKFLDVKYVFKEVDMEPQQAINIIHPEKRKKKVEGYDENDTAFHTKVKVSDFLNADNHVDLLAVAHELVFDAEDISEHPLTTQEIKECCKDIKVLGKKEIRSLLNWRKNIRKELEGKQNVEESESVEMASDGNSDVEEKMLDDKISSIKEEQEQELKRKRKKIMKEKRKLRDKMQLKMVHPGDVIEETDDICLFDIKKIKRKKDLEEVQQDDMDSGASDLDSDDPSAIPDRHRKYLMAYDRHTTENNLEPEADVNVNHSETDSSEEPSDVESEEENSDTDDEKDRNPLVVNLESKDERVSRKTDMWFSKDMFSNVDVEADEDVELEKMVEDYKKQGGTVIEKKAVKQPTKRKRQDTKEHVDTTQAVSVPRKKAKVSDSDSDSISEESAGSDSDSDISDYDIHASIQKTFMDRSRSTKTKSDLSRGKASKDGFEIVPATTTPRSVIKLDPVELALGEELIKSSKRRREIEEMSFNRFTHGDEDLPDWFAKDESRHCRKQLPVTKSQIDMYKERLRAIDARPIKKIAEAKARKKRKMTKKLERARKKAESVSDSVEMSDGEKWKQIKEIYKKAGLLSKKKKEITYVVAKKGGGKKPTRPAGVKGFYKVVDKRQKKDNRAMAKGKNKNKMSDKKSARGMKRKSKGHKPSRKS